MMNDFLKAVAPTVASALLGPLGGAAVAAVGGILGLNKATVKDVQDAIEGGALTPEQVGQLRQLELQYQENERERGFRYAELEFKDRDSARRAAVDGGMLGHLFWLSVVVLSVTLGTEVFILFNGYPDSLPEMVVGRVLGFLEATSLMTLTYWFGTSHSSAIKNGLITKVAEAGK